MNKLVVGVGAAVVLAVAGAVGSSYYIGTQIEQEFRALDVKLENMRSWPYSGALNMKVLSYERSVFSATAETEWYISPLKEEGVPALSLKMKHQIQHGPFPAMQFAKIHSTLELSDLPQELQDALKEQPLLAVDSTLGFNRAQRHVISSPKFVAENNDLYMKWDGGSGVIEIGSNLAQKLSFDAPLLEIKGDGLDFPIIIGELSLKGESVPLKEYSDLGTGESALTIKEMHLGPVVFDGLGARSSIKRDGDFLSFDIGYGVDKVKIPGEDFENIGLDIQLNKLDVATLGELVTKIQNISSEMPEEDGQKFLSETVQKILAHQPTLEIKRLGVKTKEGELNFNAQINYVGQGEIQSFNPTHLAYDIHGAIDRPLLDRVLYETVGKQLVRQRMEALHDEIGDEIDFDDEILEQAETEAIHAMVAQLEQLGLLKAADNKLTLHFQGKEGSMVLNDRPVSEQELFGLFMALSAGQIKQ